MQYSITLFLKTFSLYIINRKIHGCLEIRNLFLVLKMISHSFAALTHEISCSTLEINFSAPMYYSLCNSHSVAAHMNFDHKDSAVVHTVGKDSFANLVVGFVAVAGLAGILLDCSHYRSIQTCRLA